MCVRVTIVCTKNLLKSVTRDLLKIDVDVCSAQVPVLCRVMSANIRLFFREATNLSHTTVNIPGQDVYTFVASNDGRLQMIYVAKVEIFSYIHEATGSLPDLAAFFLCMDFYRGYLFYIEPQKRSRVTRLGAQTQHRVIQRFLSTSTSK